MRGASWATTKTLLPITFRITGRKIQMLSKLSVSLKEQIELRHGDYLEFTCFVEMDPEEAPISAQLDSLLDTARQALIACRTAAEGAAPAGLQGRVQSSRECTPSTNEKSTGIHNCFTQG